MNNEIIFVIAAYATVIDMVVNVARFIKYLTNK